jgi:ABC-type lipoprotein release transport system permease subunit
MTWGGIAFESTWYGKLNWNDIVKSVVPMWFICVIAALYPGVKAARLEPIKAMTHV